MGMEIIMSCGVKDLSRVEYLKGDVWKLVQVCSLVHDDKDLCRCPGCKGKVELQVNGKTKPHFRHAVDRKVKK